MCNETENSYFDGKWDLFINLATFSRVCGRTGKSALRPDISESVGNIWKHQMRWIHLEITFFFLKMYVNHCVQWVSNQKLLLLYVNKHCYWLFTCMETVTSTCCCDHFHLITTLTGVKRWKINASCKQINIFIFICSSLHHRCLYVNHLPLHSSILYLSPLRSSHPHAQTLASVFFLWTRRLRLYLRASLLSHLWSSANRSSPYPPLPPPPPSFLSLLSFLSCRPSSPLPYIYSLLFTLSISLSLPHLSPSLSLSPISSTQRSENQRESGGSVEFAPEWQDIKEGIFGEAIRGRQNKKPLVNLAYNSIKIVHVVVYFG